MLRFDEYNIALLIFAYFFVFFCARIFHCVTVKTKRSLVSFSYNHCLDLLIGNNTYKKITNRNSPAHRWADVNHVQLNDRLVV